MLKHIKIMVLPLLLAVILAALSLSGCGGNDAEPDETAGGLTGEEAQQVVADSMVAMKNVNSYTFSMDMDMDMEAVGGSSPGKVTATMEMDAAMDMAAKIMRASFEMSFDEISVEGVTEDMPQNISMEMYMIEETAYVKMDMPEIGEQWVKMPFTEEMKEIYNLDMVEQQMTPLESASDIEYLRSEKVDGSDCYVLKIVPDMAAMLDWFEAQQTATGGLGFGEMESLEDVFKNLSYTAWIDKDSKLMRKINIGMSMEMNAEEFGAGESEFDSMTMDITMGMNIGDFNEPVPIDLPEEAEDAPEMSL
jgi:hypothetical protein